MHMASAIGFGRKIRAARMRQGLSQAGLATRLGVSASYLNLVEHERRPVSANLLIRLAQALDLDLRSFAGSQDAKLAADLMEVFGDPVFEGNAPAEAEIRELVAQGPDIARAVVQLHHAYTSARVSATTLAAQVLDRQDLAGLDRSGLSAEQVTDFIQRYLNHFPELEEDAE